MDLSDLPLPPVPPPPPPADDEAQKHAAWQNAMKALEKVNSPSIQRANSSFNTPTKSVMMAQQWYNGYDDPNMYMMGHYDASMMSPGVYGMPQMTYAQQPAPMPSTPPTTPWGWGVGSRLPNKKSSPAQPRQATPKPNNVRQYANIPPPPQLNGSDSIKKIKPFNIGKIDSIMTSPVTQNPSANASILGNDKQKNVMNSASWPPALKDYATRAFAKCKTEIDQNQVQIVLKGKITSAIDSGKLWEKNWADEPLPSVYSDALDKIKRDEEERQKRIQNEQEAYKMSLIKSKQIERERLRNSTQKRESTRDTTPIKRGTPEKESKLLSSSRKENKSDRQSSSKLSLSDRLGPKENTLEKSPPAQKKRKSQIMSKVSSVDDDLINDPHLLQKRARRFGGGPSVKVRKTDMSMNSTLFDCNFDDCADAPVEGTCTDIQKAYFRLTSAPDPSTVRPVHVLRKSLDFIKSHWCDNQEYRFACDQLKSIRQDLTVQCVRSLFTIEVYETHARIALERGDHEEFNQCQTQLLNLYGVYPDAKHRLEFTGYKLLYQVFTENVMDMNETVKALGREERAHPVISHAIRVIYAWNTRNFYRLFKLYESAPRMAPYVMEWCLGKERIAAYKSLTKAFRPDLPLEFLEKNLCLNGRPELMAFLGEQKAIVKNGLLNCKDSWALIS